MGSTAAAQLVVTGKPGQHGLVQHGTSVDCKHSRSIDKCNYMILLSVALALHMTNVDSYFDTLAPF